MTRVHMINGQEIDLLAEEPRVPGLTGIAISLSRQARFTGHTIRTWSVAHHLLLTRQLCADPKYRWEALGHDFSETITGDVSTPVKQALGDAWDSLELRIQRAMCCKYLMEFPFPNAVHDADRLALHVEWCNLRPSVVAPSLPERLKPQVAAAQRHFDYFVEMTQAHAQADLERLACQDFNRRQFGVA